MMAVRFVFCGAPKSSSRCASDSCLFLRLFSTYLVALFTLYVRSFALSCCILFCTVQFLSLGDLFFLMGNVLGIAMCKREEVSWSWEERREEKLWSDCTVT